MSAVGELRRLLESGEYWGCLERGRDLLVSGELTEEEQARVLSTLSRCHLALGQLQAAATAAGKAAALAGRAGLHDLEGACLLDQATALSAHRQHEEALNVLHRFRQGLPAYTASLCLEGNELQLTAATLVALGRTPEGAEWYDRADRWFQRFGDERSAAECRVGAINACLAAWEGLGEPDPWRPEVERRLAGAEESAALANPETLARLALARSRSHRLAGEDQDAANEGFRALLLAESLSPLQVEIQLHLSRMAEAMNRPVDALSFAFAARTTAIDGRLYPLEFEASALFIRLIQRYGAEPLAELTGELAKQGVDICQYLDAAEAERLARGE